MAKGQLGAALSSGTGTTSGSARMSGRRGMTQSPRALWLLVALEIGAIMLARHGFRHAHGGQEVISKVKQKWWYALGGYLAGSFFGVVSLLGFFKRR